jgi:hypothetical protein
MPDEKDIAFKGEVKTAKETVYRKGESRAIQVHLTSNDEEAKDAQFKILSATLADGSPADLDYTSLELGYNTLSYTPKGPGTHEITLRVAVEGEGNVQDIHCPIEAPLANWKVEGRANSEGNITLTIEGAPDEWRSEPWQITNSQLSEGLEGRIEPTELHYGENQFRIILTKAVLAEPHVCFTVQGPDSETRTCQIYLTRLCIEQLSGTLRGEEQSLVERLENVNEYVQRTNDAYTLTPEIVSDPIKTSQRQAEITRLLGQLTAFKTQYQEDIQAFEHSLETLEQAEVSENLPVFKTNNTSLEKAIASLKSAQVQLQQHCATAETTLMLLMQVIELGVDTAADIDIMIRDPKLNIRKPLVTNNWNYPTLLFWAAGNNLVEVVRAMMLTGWGDLTDINHKGETVLHIAVMRLHVEMVQEIINLNPDVLLKVNNRQMSALSIAQIPLSFRFSSEERDRQNQIITILTEAEDTLQE